jgi:hypothetical protein
MKCRGKGAVGNNFRVGAGKRYPGDTYFVPTWPLLSRGGG